MNLTTVIKIIVSFKALALLLGLFYWHRYTTRGGLTLIGILIVSPIIGGILGLGLTFPFIKFEEGKGIPVEIEENQVQKQEDQSSPPASTNSLAHPSFLANLRIKPF